MNFKALCMSALTAGAISFAGLAQAVPLAGIIANGTYDISTDEIDGTSVFDVNGGFIAGFDPNVLPTQTSNFSLGVFLDIESVAPIEFMFQQTLTVAEFNVVLAEGIALVNTLISSVGMPLDLPGIGTLLVDGNVDESTDTSVGVGFSAALETTSPIGPLMDFLIADTLMDTGLVIPELDGFSFPANESGAFTLFAVLDVAPVPLPASLPMLLLAAGGLIALRRRKTA